MFPVQVSTPGRVPLCFAALTLVVMTTSEPSECALHLIVREDGATPVVRGHKGPTVDASTIEKPMTAEELSAILPLHPETIRKWAREGSIPCVRLSARRVVFLPSRIRAWLEARNGYTESAGRTAPTEMEKAA